MDQRAFKIRTKSFALRTIKLVESLPKSNVAAVLGKQLLRSATSVGANYRAACRARSTADFVSKMGIVEEECDECIYWIELMVDAGLVKGTLVEGLKGEAAEILAMTVSSIKTARSRK